MTTARTRDLVSVAGYSLGVGLACLPLIGIPVRFMLPDSSALLIYCGAFAAGLVAGALVGWRRGLRT